MHIYSELKEAQLETRATDPTPATTKKGHIYHKDAAAPIKVSDGATIHKVLTDQMYADIASEVNNTIFENTRGKVAHLFDRKSNGTAGGSATAVGGNPPSRVLNTLIDPDSIILNSADFTGTDGVNTKITLAAGVYDIEIHAPAYCVAGHRIVLRDDARNILDIGTSENSGTSSYTTTHSKLVTRLTLASQKDLYIDHLTVFANTISDFGISVGLLTFLEQFTTAKITKIAEAI